VQDSLMDHSEKDIPAEKGDRSVGELKRGELELVQQAKAGDREAMTAILESYQHRVYSVCRRMVDRPEEADDLTQDVLTSVLMNLPSYRGDSALSTWIIRIAINTTLSHMRSKKRRREHNVGDLSDHTQSGNDFYDQNGSFSLSDRKGGSERELTGSGGVEQSERRTMLMIALGQVNEQTRVLLILRDFQNLEYQQISDVLEIPVGTVKSRLFRARMTLRKMIEHQEASQNGVGEVGENT